MRFLGKKGSAVLAGLAAAAALSLGAINAAAAAPAAAQKTEAPKSVGSADMAALLRPSEIKDMSEGAVNAPITIIEYASLTCGHCADFYLGTMPQLRENYIKTGKVHYIMRELAMDPRAIAATMLTRCVAEDKFFPFVQILLEKQAEWAFAPDAKTPLMRFAKMAGLNDEQFNACLTNQKMFDELKKNNERNMKDFDIKVTPTLFINGQKYQGALTYNEISAIIDNILDKAADKK